MIDCVSVQVKRLRWKNDLVQNTEERLSWEPIPLPGRVKYVLHLPSMLHFFFNPFDPSLSGIFLSLDALPEYMYRRFFVQGTLQPRKSILIGPRKHGEVVGYHLIMPLVRGPEPSTPLTPSSPPSTILINLGFVSNEAAESYRALASSPASGSAFSSRSSVQSGLPEFNGQETIIEALIPAPQTPNWFTPGNKPEHGEWVWADVRAMAQYAGGEEANVVPLLMDEIFGSYALMRLIFILTLLVPFFFFPEGNIGEANQRIAKGVPVGRAPVVTFRNQHASYAVTWFVTPFTIGRIFSPTGFAFNLGILYLGLPRFCCTSS